MVSSALPLILLLMSFIHSGLTQDVEGSNSAPAVEQEGVDSSAFESEQEPSERPKAVVKVTPDQRVFRGETVTLTCDIQGAGDIQWTYSWFKDGNTFYPYTTTAEISFRASVSDRAEYSCRGERSDSQRSDTSTAVKLTVSDLPTTTLTVSPNSVFTGERVILMCEITPYYSDWRYEWYKGTAYYSVLLETSKHYTVNTNTLNIERSETSDAGQYWCRGHIDGGSVSSQSSSVSLSVKDLPRPTLTVTPDSPVFTGERVILTCEITPYYSDWRYEWNKDNTEVSESYTNTFTIERSETSDAGPYTCRGQRDGRPNSSQSSSAVYLSVKDLPTSTLTVTPDSPVFTGERVDLKCVIESHSDWRQRNGMTYWTYDWTPEWRYEWYKDRNDNNVILKDSQHYTVNRDTLTIRGATESDQDQFWCRGERDKRPNLSQPSSVSLSVKALPTSTLTVTPNSVFTGETVILMCVINSDHSDWRYEWNKDSYKVSESHTVKGNTLTIERSETSDAGLYTCRGQRYGRPNSSQSSSAVSLSVTALPTSSLTVTPDSPVFTGERVILTCEITSYYSDWRYEWRYEWYKGSVMLQTSEHYTVNTYTFTIEQSKTSDAGLYTCKGQRNGRPNSSQSSSVSLTVKDLPTSTLTLKPDSPVFTGETVNLTCVINSDHSDWKYEWYKGTNNSVKLQTSERYTIDRDTLTIRGLNESDQGQFWCRGHRDKRPNSSQESERINLSVNASSSLLVTGVVVGLSVCLLFFLSLLLMWRYKKNKDQQRNINQTSVPNQSAQSQLENFPLQSDSDHIYDDVTEVNMRDKDDPEPLADVTYSEVTVKKKMDRGNTKAESNNVTYSTVGKRGKKCKSKDINPAGPSDLTYAQINIQDKKKTKGKGKSSESGDTLYSELNTDRDADAGVGDATHVLAFWKKGHKKIKTCP